jgi:hypothetical protein
MRNCTDSRNSMGAVVVVLVALAIATDLTKTIQAVGVYFVSM